MPKRKTPPGTVPHIEQPRDNKTAITSGHLFAHPRTEAIQGFLSSLYAPGNASATLQLFQAIKDTADSTTNYANRIHAQELVNAKQIERLKKDARNNVTAAEKIAQLPDSIPYQVQPPPSDIWGMMRSSEPMLRANGDVWQTIVIPAQVMFNKDRPIRIGASDVGARKEWDKFFDDETGIIPINKWARDCYFTVEQYGQWFPLEYWQNNKDLIGIAALEPTSMWIGHHLGMGYPPMSIITPEQFDEAKWRDMQHDAAFTTFVNDLNVQTFPAFRIPLRPDILSPVFGFGRKAFERYAIPHLARAYNDMMYRLMLHEYRQGVLESWIAQIFMFVVKGWGNQPPSKGAVPAVQALIESAIAGHKGELVLGYDVTATTLKPDKLDDVMATDSWIEATQTIMRHLGIDVFVLSGEIAGTHGRGGGVQVEISMQVALERWKSHLIGYFEWARHIARKWAEKNDPSLLKSLPHFKIGPSMLETQKIVESLVKPMVANGLMSRTTALDRADENYTTELENKQNEQEYDELFSPPPTFAQTSFDGNPGSEPKTTYQQTPGRPKGAKNDADESIRIHGQWQDHTDLKDRIAVMFGLLMDKPLRENATGFISQLESILRAQMGAVYSDGFHHQGGLGDLNLAPLTTAPQGIKYQVERLMLFRKELLGALDQPEQLGAMRHRATQYAGALVTAYILGTQQAAKSMGASHWRRQLHPELSLSGLPCAACVADSAVLHPIDQEFVSLHPNENCSQQSVMYQFAGDTMPLTVLVPPTIRPNARIRRAPYGGNG